MKQEVSPAVMAIVIAVVVIVVGFFGYKMLMGGKGGSDPAHSTSNREEYLKTHPEAAKIMQQMQGGGNQGRTSGGSMGAMSGGR